MIDLHPALSPKDTISDKYICESGSFERTCQQTLSHAHHSTQLRQNQTVRSCAWERKHTRLEEGNDFQNKYHALVSSTIMSYTEIMGLLVN